MRKGIRSILIVVLVLSMFTVAPAAPVLAHLGAKYETWNNVSKGYFRVDGLSYQIQEEINYTKRTNGKVWVSMDYNSTLKEVVVPATVKKNTHNTLGYDVVGIESYGFSSNPITSILIGANVKEIGDSAFYFNETLKKVKFSSKLLYIGETSFAGCTALTSISIPEKVKTLEAGVFSECTALKTVKLANGVTEIKESAFRVCSSLTKVTLSKKLKKIGNDAFAYCTALKMIELPDSLIELGERCFGGDTSLKNLTIPEKVTKIPKEMCGDCENFETLKLGVKVKEIGEYAFYGCAKLSGFDCPRYLNKIGDGAFWGSGVIELDFPNSLKTIGKSAFFECMSLKAVDLPEGVTEIGESSFGRCNALTTVSIPSTLKTIPDGAFDGYLSNLTSLTLSEGVESIEEGAFADNTKLSDISFPKSIEYIAGTAFDNTAFANNIRLELFHDTENYLGYYLVNDILLYINHGEAVEYTTQNGIPYKRMVAKTVFDIPANVRVISADISPYYTYDIKEINIPAGVKRMTGDINCGVEHIKLPTGLEEMPRFAGCKNLKSINIPTKITEIPSLAFSGCESLKSVTLPEGLKTIGEAAFFYSGLEAITLPDTLERLSSDAFSNSNITSITISGDICEVGALRNCRTLERVTFKEGCTIINMHLFEDCSNLASVKLPSTIKSIENYAFCNCSKLTDINFPESLKVIKGDAFKGCESLEKITLPSKIETINTGAFDGTAIKNIKIPKSCTTLEYVAFSSGTTVKIAKKSKLLIYTDGYKRDGWKVVTY